MRTSFSTVELVISNKIIYIEFLVIWLTVFGDNLFLYCRLNGYQYTKLKLSANAVNHIIEKFTYTYKREDTCVFLTQVQV